MPTTPPFDFSFPFIAFLSFETSPETMAQTYEDQDQTRPLLPQSDTAGGAGYGIIPEERSNVPPPAEAEEPNHPTERWNDPPINAWRVAATYYSFIVVGANDGAYGVCI